MVCRFDAVYSALALELVLIGTISERRPFQQVVGLQKIGKI